MIFGMIIDEQIITKAIEEETNLILEETVEQVLNEGYDKNNQETEGNGIMDN